MEITGRRWQNKSWQFLVAHIIGYDADAQELPGNKKGALPSRA